MRILVVDDDPFAAEMTAAILEGLGHDAVLAASGAEALEILSAGPGPGPGIGLIISDMNMPLLDGIGLFRETRARGLIQPFVLLTGDDPSGRLAGEPGLDACLMKDFDLEDRLSQVLAAVLTRHGSAR